ncbi:MAG TPA: citrate/2-methylcitrate synthase [Myxococcota bacterium]|nr:citrate/2-methylcitrate synthase [Myxococcota bacterium]
MSEAIQEYRGALDKGLEGVVACSTAISTIAGTTLLYRGYTIEDLAENATFEEVVFLLWYGRLPKADELERFERELRAAMPLPPESFGWFHGLPTEVHPMDFLHAVVAGLSLHDPDANVIQFDANIRKAVRLTARLATIVAAYDRVRNGQWPLQPLPGRSLAWNFLYMLHGREPEAKRVRQLDTCLILHADHELNASAFSARVTSSTLSGMYSSVMAAIGTLKGPLHGGANEQVMRMLQEIGGPSRLEAYLDDALGGKRKVMGFGHRVYKEGDPRAAILKRMSRELTAETGHPELYEMSAAIEEIMQERKGLIPNVDFYSATVYYSMGIPIDLFTPVFAASRVAGWCAHTLEQYANNRIYRPRGYYNGPTGLRYVPIEKR